MSEKFYKVDLHVHTPASKCYKGEKTEKGYWEILQSAVDNGVRMIAITDHNTVAGYEKLIELRENTIREYDIIQKYNISHEEKRVIEEKVNLFNKVSIIMGVEITLNPGVHIIVLGDENSKEDIDSLLMDIGYLPENQGSDNDIVTEMDVKCFLSDERLSDKIILAPHIDSDKGIWNALEGNYRATVLKSSTITGITCNNTLQLNKIKDLARNDPLYKRNKPFVCINASDAHIPSSIGEKHSFFKLKDFSFADLKKAFDSPEEFISDTERQDFMDYVKKCAEYKPTIYINDIKNIKMACYAILNYGYGCILIGINRDYQQTGINMPCEKIEELVESEFKTIQDHNNSRYASYKMKLEKLGNGKSIGIIIADSEESRLWIDNLNDVYIYCEKSGYKVAGIREIETII